MSCGQFVWSGLNTVPGSAATVFVLRISLGGHHLERLTPRYHPLVLACPETATLQPVHRGRGLISRLDLKALSPAGAGLSGDSDFAACPSRQRLDFAVRSEGEPSRSVS
jgi:hypothetical protein